MGGCRCTFRDCSVSTLKNPGMHFFHFPIKERERFQRWLDLCKTHDMLELPLSKQRNRVICARHFRDECFMNYKKERLVNSALPTLMRLSKTQAVDYENNIQDGELVTLTASRMPHLIPPPDFKCPLDMDNEGESFNVKLTDVNSVYSTSNNEKSVLLDRQKHSEHNSSNLKRKSACHSDGTIQKYKIIHNKSNSKSPLAKSANVEEIFLSDVNSDETILSLNDILSEDTIDAIEGLSNNSYETDGAYKEEEISCPPNESRQILEVNKWVPREYKKAYSKFKSKTSAMTTEHVELTEDHETKHESMDYNSQEIWLSSQQHAQMNNGGVDEEMSQITYESKMEDECKQSDTNNIKELPLSTNSNSSKYPLNIVLAVRRDLQNNSFDKSKAENSNVIQKWNGTKELTIANMESKCKERRCQYITLKKKYDDLLTKYSQLQQKFNELEEQQVATVSTSHDAKITTATITYTAATLSKAQLFNSIKRYLNAAMISLLRIEMFGSADREWKSDERHVAVDLLNLGEPVYKHFTDEWRFHLPSLRLVRDWLNHTIDVDDEEDI